jgi:ribosome-binding protein aMBF1 (putative translation factor)
MIPSWLVGAPTDPELAESLAGRSRRQQHRRCCVPREEVSNHLKVLHVQRAVTSRHLKEWPIIRGMPTLSDRLARGVRAERSRHGWRQADLAQRAGLTVDIISAIERGSRQVDLDDALRLCRGLGVPLVKLLDGADSEDLRTLGLLQ